MTTEQERFYGRANTAVDTAFRFAIGYAIGRMLRVMSVRQRWLTLALVGCVVGWVFTHRYNEETFNEDPTVWSNVFLYSGVILFIFLCKDLIAVGKARQAQQLAFLQAQQAQVPAPRPAPRPVAQRTERTVTVTRTPPTPPAAPTAPSSAPTPPRTPTAPTGTTQDVVQHRSIIVVTNTHKSVRHTELNSGLRINDRRGYDPELGE